MVEDTGRTQQRQRPATYPRFSAGQRFEHMVLIVTFTGLALTGLPQRYADTAIGQGLIDLMGGIESVRLVHRILATVLMAAAIYHGGIVSYKLFVLGRRALMIPGFRDIRDVLHWMAYNLGWVRNHPQMPRYNFGEKAEYWAVVWGTVVMIITGFMLWNPIATTEILPGEAVPAAQIAHSAEAVLAVLSIITWHMYNVHIRRFNRSIFTGRIRREAMEEEHAEELSELERGVGEIRRSPRAVLRRRLLFLPIAIFMTIALVSGLVWFVTFEETAIETVTRVDLSNGEISVSADVGDAATGAALWQELECQVCHGVDAQGGTGTLEVSLANPSMDFPSFVGIVRRGPADMPAYTVEQISDEELAHLYAWLRSIGGV